MIPINPVFNYSQRKSKRATAEVILLINLLEVRRCRLLNAVTFPLDRQLLTIARETIERLNKMAD